MAEDSKIQWTTHTFNPWRGCTKISDGCKFCYADTLSKRNPGTLGVWGPNGTRVVAAETAWREPLKWNKHAGICRGCGWHREYETGMCPTCGVTTFERPRVFCASLADVFEDWQGPMTDAKGETLYSTGGELHWQTAASVNLRAYPGFTAGGDDFRITMQSVRQRLFELIEVTPHLDWLLLTKRPENILRMLPHHWVSDGKPGPLGPTELVGSIPHNVWLGTSTEDQKAADERVPHLLKCPAAVRFLSMEPLLGPVDLRNYLKTSDMPDRIVRPGSVPVEYMPVVGIDWVILGGESGPDSRPMDLIWIRDITHQCEAAGVPCFVKQLGQKPLWMEQDATAETDLPRTLWRQPCLDRKGGDPDEWPADLKVRCFPNV